MQTPRPWTRVYPEGLRGYAFDVDAIPDSLDRMTESAAQQFTERLAFNIVLPGGQSAGLTYRQVDELSNAFASFLVHQLGLAVGDAIGVQLPNSLHYPIAVFGAWKAGLIVTNINPLYTAPETRYQLVDSKAKLLVVFDMALPRVEPIADALGNHILVVSLGDFFGPDPLSPSRASGDQPLPVGKPAFIDALRIGKTLPHVDRQRQPIALYQYTGGTTGRSKGAIITHRNLFAALVLTRDFMRACGAGPQADETVLTVLPLYHVFAFLINFLLFFDAGASNVLIPSPRPLSNVRAAFERFKIDWMSGVDTLYAGLLAEDWFRNNPPKLKWAMSGGTALLPSTAELWQRLVCPILEGYGMTETSCIVSISPLTQEPRMGTVGVPLPGTDVRVVDTAGRDLDPWQPGELLVRGPQVIEAYLDQPEETSSAIVDGWLHTGDIGQFEDDGYLRIVDRKKDMIIVSGFNVYPNEVEAVIASHPGVAEVAVIGRLDARTGEAVCAFVVPRFPDLKAVDIIEFSATQLTGYKVPKQVEFRTELPKSTVGKVLRAQLRALP